MPGGIGNEEDGSICKYSTAKNNDTSGSDWGLVFYLSLACSR